MKHKVFCIIGRTASGKSTIVNAVAKNLNLSVLKSYTTRARRKNEIGDNCDHTFISSDEVDKYKNDMVAYTERVGYCSFATLHQFMNSNLYIINPSGYSDLVDVTKDNPNLELISIWIECDKDALKNRSKSRANSDNWEQNYIKEEVEFSTYYPNIDINKSYFVDNNGDISDSIKNVENIIYKEYGVTRL